MEGYFLFGIGLLGALVVVCGINGKNAAKGNRSGLAALLATLGLFVAFTGLGVYTAIRVGGAYLVFDAAATGSIVGCFSAMGLLVSWLVLYVGSVSRAHRNFLETQGGALCAPCEITIIKCKTPLMSGAKYIFYLNGEAVGFLRGEGCLSAHTNQRYNKIEVKQKEWVRTGGKKQTITPYYFEALDGGTAELHFNGRRFVPRKTLVLPAPLPKVYLSKKSTVKPQPTCVEDHPTSAVV